MGSNPPTHAQNPAASCPADPTSCNYVNNYLSSTPNANILFGALVEGDGFTDDFTVRLACSPPAPGLTNARIALSLLQFSRIQVSITNSVSWTLQDVRSQNDTRVPIHNNAGFIGALASMQYAPGTWEQCLQGYGVLNKANSIC